MSEDDAMPGRRAGQGDRDVTPALSAERDRSEEMRASGHSDMPDFTSGPGYTGEISRNEKSGRAGSDISES